MTIGALIIAAALTTGSLETILYAVELAAFLLVLDA